MSQKERKEVLFKVMNENARSRNLLSAETGTTASCHRHRVGGEMIAEAQHFSKKKAEQLSAEATCVKLGIT